MFFRRKPQPADKLKIGFNDMELDAVVAFLRWMSAHFHDLNLSFELAAQLRDATKYKVSQRTKRQFMTAVMDAGVHDVEQESDKLVRLRWTHHRTRKSFGFVVEFDEAEPEVKLRVVDSKARSKALAFFLVWATKQLHYRILPPAEFLELDKLFASAKFTPEMTQRMLELLLASDIRSISANGRHLEVELQAPHRQAETYTISLLTQRIRKTA